MAKVTSPLFSETATGSIGKKIVFSTNKYRSVVRGNRLRKTNEYYLTSNPYHSQTQEQEGIRQTFSAGRIDWNNLTNEQKSIYNNSAINKKMTGYNLFMKEYIENNYLPNKKRLEWLFIQGFNSFVNSFNKSDMSTAMQGIARG